MPRNLRVTPDNRDPADYTHHTRQNYGDGPWFKIELEYSGGWFEEYMFLGVEQLQQLHKATGALLAKRGLSRA